MAHRSYRTWDTSGLYQYIPRGIKYDDLDPEDTEKAEDSAYLNPYKSYHTYRRSYRSLEETGHRIFKHVNPFGRNFDFVSGRYSYDNRFTCLRDAEEPTYLDEIMELYLTNNKVQEEYNKEVMQSLDRCSGVRAVIGSRGETTMLMAKWRKWDSRAARWQYLK